MSHHNSYFEVKEGSRKSTYFANGFDHAIFSYRSAHNIQSRAHKNDNGEVTVTRLTDGAKQNYRWNS